MSSKPFDVLWVVGAGTMGAQIALQSALHGYTVHLVDSEEKALKGASQRHEEELNARILNGDLTPEESSRVKGRIHASSSLDGLSPPGLVIEAVVEDLAVKRDVFQRLDTLCPPSTILATNSSSIKISAIESATKRPDRVLNLHFYNPVWQRPVVELMRGTATSDDTIETARRFARSIGVTNEDGTEGLVFLSGMDLLHTGLELEMDWRPVQLFRFILSGSIADWKNTNDVSGVYRDYGDEGGQDIEYNYYVKDLKTGDAPQTQVYLGGVLYPLSGLALRVDYRYYTNHYAAWDPFSRTDERYPDQGGDRGVQSWKAPSYGVLDLHAYYNLPINFVGIRPQIFAHVFNALDTKYIQDATDNSRYNAWDKDHDADDAEVFFGMPTYFNVGFSLVF